MTSDLDRATEALREIAYIHQPVADGARIICRHRDDRGHAMTPKEVALFVAGGLATLASLTIVAAGIIGAAIYKRLGVPPPENYDDGNLPGCLLSLGMLLTLLTGLPALVAPNLPYGME